MSEADKKREIVSVLMSKGILLDRNMLTQINQITDVNRFHDFLLAEIATRQSFNLTESITRFNEKSSAISQSSPSVSKIIDLPKIEEKIEKKIDDKPFDMSKAMVDITFSYEGEPKKREFKDFVGYFNSRYNAIKPMLQNRKELQNLTSINRLTQKREREQSALIAIVTDKQLTKTDKIILTVEDPTGTIKVIISPTSDAYEPAKDTVLDEIVGIVGMAAGDIMFGNKLIIPDIPLYKEMKKSPDEVYALFLGDFHFGSNLFLHESFQKLLTWIRGEQGSEKQKDIASKIKYIFVSGDLVEGVGIYPNQENDLEIKDIYEQYSGLARELKKIPSHIPIIMCPGNHDAMRIAEPQPPLYKDFAEAIWKLPNAIMVSSPSYINIHKSDAFPGFDILLYHGFSFPWYADVVESIRNMGGQKRSDLIMKFLLQRRHLAPTHKSTLYLPDAQKDSLVIDKIPDFFVSGHIHRTSAANYRNVTMLNCSSWLEMTDYQEKVGLIPQPGRALLVNLQTRKVKVLKFYDDPNEERAKQEEKSE